MTIKVQPVIGIAGVDGESLVGNRMAHQDGVPDEVGLLYDFLNSLDLRSFYRRHRRHLGGDEFARPGGLTRWLQTHELLRFGLKASPSEERRAVALRQVLRDAVRANSRNATDIATEAVFASVARRFPVQVSLGAGNRPEVVPTEFGVGAALTSILTSAVLAAGSGRWQRLKVCGAEDCRWVFYDHSRPRTGRWCVTAICGNRIKSERHRQRLRGRRASPALGSDESF